MRIYTLQSILKEINLEHSWEGLTLKLKLQYFGHLMRRADSLEKTLMLGKTEGGRRRRPFPLIFAVQQSDSVTHTHTHTHTLLHVLFHSGCHSVLNVVPWAARRSFLLIHPVCNSSPLLIPDSFPARPWPPLQPQVCSLHSVGLLGAPLFSLSSASWGGLLMGLLALIPGEDEMGWG